MAALSQRQSKLADLESSYVLIHIKILQYPENPKNSWITQECSIISVCL